MKLQWTPAWLRANGNTGSVTRTPGKDRARSSHSSDTCNCCEETKNKLVSHVSDADNDDDDDDDAVHPDDDDDDHDDDDLNETCPFRDPNSSWN